MNVLWWWPWSRRRRQDKAAWRAEHERRLAEAREAKTKATEMSRQTDRALRENGFVHDIRSILGA
jgi:hypothetical protein